MNYNKRQLEQKKKTEEYLRSLVEKSGTAPQNNSKPPSQTAAKAAVKPVKKPPVKYHNPNLNTKPKKKKPPVNKENTLARFADTIENYRTKPMSKKKKRRRNAFYRFLIVLIFLGLFLGSLTIFFKLGSFSIQGSARYSDEKIIAACNIPLETNLFKINKFQIQADIEEALPYVKKAEIKRNLPSSLSITIYETKAKAAIAVSSGYVLIDEDSKILEKTADNKGLPVLKGAVITSEIREGLYATYADENAVSLIKDVINNLETQGFNSSITSIDVAKRYDIRFVCGENITCVLGDSTDMDVKMGMIKVVLEKNPQSVPALIDATDPNRVYYRPEN